MDKKRRLSFPVTGGISLLTIFAVLCLTVFALLSLSTVLADGRLSDRSAQAVTEYYDADRRAEEIFAGLRAGQVPEEVTEADGVYSYACPISDTQALLVSVQRRETGWTVLQWKTVSTAHWQTDGSLNLWDGDPDMKNEE